jgi:hypothetical protein
VRLRRAAATAVALVAALTGTPVAAGTASAAPPSGRAAPDPLPVSVTVEALEPRDLRPDSTVRVVAVLRNTSASATGPLRVRLERGRVLTTRGELASADTDPPVTGAVTGPPAADPAGLAPGQARRITYRATAAELGLAAGSPLGVYPVALVAQAVDQGFVTVARARTLLPYFPPTIDTAGTRVTLLWPLLDRPRRLTGSGDRTGERSPPVFLDDGLATSVRRGGRLDRLLTAAEKVTGSVRLTLVVDPETVEALDQMRSGYRVTTRAGRMVTGRGGPAAARWLARLQRIAPRHLLVATPYADPDVVALERAGNSALARVEQPDVDATARVLGRAPTTKVAWPPDGLLTDRALDDVVTQGAGVVVLDPAALPGGPTPEGGRTPDAASPLPALGGRAVALVGDPTLQRLLAAAGRSPGPTGGPRLAEQRLLAELGMITAEAPSDGRTLLLAPPRRWDPPAAYAEALAADLGRLPWLRSVAATDAAEDQVDRGPLVYPPTAQRLELPAGQVQQLDEVQALVDDFRGALDNADANALLSPYGDALRRAGSSAWRTNPRAGAAYMTRLRAQIAGLRGRVTLTSPAGGVYTLASGDSPLVLTLRNDLDVPVTVRLRLVSPPGFTAEDKGDILLGAGDRRSVQVQASVERTGTFRVRGQLVSPGGGPLGDEVTLTVRSTAFGGLALGITGIAFAVLVGAVGVRLVRRLRDRPEPVPAGSPADRSRSGV